MFAVQLMLQSEANAWLAITIPNPVSRSQPAASMSIAVDVRIVLICAGVSAGLNDLMSAAIAPACGADADVPKKGLKPGAAHVTPSAAVMSGFCSSCPPVDEKLPGVIGLLSALKNIRLGPSDVNNSLSCDEVKRPGKGPAGLPGADGLCAGAAATEYPSAHALWPKVTPEVAMLSRPRFVLRCKKRPAPENLTITIREFAGRPPALKICSKGSCVPF